MLEFSSISVSSYDAASLAGKLTEKSGEGWDVVAIVSAGTNVTAYLSRDSAAAEAAPAVEPEAAAVVEPVEEPAVEEPSAEQPAAATSFEPVLPAAAAAAAATPVEEPAGWAAEPEAATTEATDATTSWASDTTTVATPEPEPVVVTPEPEPEPVQAAASAAMAPAGWYADPSGRYELRYWDGSQWTEHVSRAGQQYTDPPVA